MKQVIAIAVGTLLLPVVLISAAVGALGFQPTGASPLDDGAFDIPGEMAALYVEAASRFGIRTSVLAAVGKVECDHNRNRACDRPNFAGAQGPMQFLPATFAAYGKASGSVSPNIYDARDAVFAAASMLSANGINANERRAIYSYNHSNSYVDLVLSWASKYDGLGAQESKAGKAIAMARSYLGVPYLWGGTGRNGIDCSGLVLRSFEAVGVQMPRVAQDQAARGVRVASVADVRPGDLLAYGSDNSITHITIATDKPGQMIEAPRAGIPVREVPIRTKGLVIIRRVLN